MVTRASSSGPISGICRRPEAKACQTRMVWIRSIHAIAREASEKSIARPRFGPKQYWQPAWQAWDGINMDVATSLMTCCLYRICDGNSSGSKTDSQVAMAGRHGADHFGKNPQISPAEIVFEGRIRPFRHDRGHVVKNRCIFVDKNRVSFLSYCHMVVSGG